MKKQKVLLYIAIALMWFSIYVYTPILSTYCEDLGATYTLVGTVLSSYGFVQMVMRIPIGIFTDLLRRRKVVMGAGFAFAFFSSLGFFLAEVPTLLIICRALSGLCASTWAIFLISYTSLYPDEEQGKGMGLANSANSIGQVFATLIGGFVAQYIGIKVPFVVGMIAALTGTILLFFVREPQIEQKEKITVRRLVSMLGNFDLVFYSIMAAFLMLALYTGPNGFVTNMLRDLKATDFMLGFASTLAMIPSVFSAALSGTFFKEKLGARNSMILGFVLVAVSILGMGLAKSIFMIIVMLLVNGFAKGLLNSLLNSMAIQKIDKSLKSTGASFYQSVYGIGMTLGPIIAGVISDSFSMMAAFVFAAALMVIPVAAILIKREKA
ncbi:MAG: MFS transporter [Clostridia bacterium]|nr:MFS transporter [Clostridia bacterium]